MKSKKIIYLERVLRFMAMAVLKRHKPRIVGITGSVGKTSAKEAIFLVLDKKFKTRKSGENYNNEIGTPLTIIGAKSGGKNPLKWLWIFLKWIFTLIFPFGYPEVLVLELAVDRPGDMEYLMGFIPVEVGVLTNVSSSHLEFFKDIDEIADEKSVLVKSLPIDGLAVLNLDNSLISGLKDKLNSKVVDFAIKNEAKIKATDIQFIYGENDKKIKGLSFKLNYRGSFFPIRLHNIIAGHQIYAALAAVAVGDHFKVNLIDIAKSLEDLESPRGRMTPIDGIRGSLIIDDTYNSSPVSTMAAMETVSRMRAFRRVAVLGDMLELGKDSESSHKQVIEELLKSNFDLIILVGKRMNEAVAEIKKTKAINKKIINFSSPEEAGAQLRKMMIERDLILVKGSQSMRMERVVEAIMERPEEAGDILCRQSNYWRKKSFKQV